MTPSNPNFADDVATSFAKQAVMKLIGARLSLIEPGIVEIALPYRPDLTQQDGYLHAGIVTTIADSACGYAAFTLMPAGAAVLSVEFKVNLLRPAKGDSFVARRSNKVRKNSDGCAGGCLGSQRARPVTHGYDAGDHDVSAAETIAVSTIRPPDASGGQRSQSRRAV